MSLVYELIAILNLIFLLIDININDIHQSIKINEVLAAPHFINIRFFNQFQSWILPILTLAFFYFHNHPRIKKLAFIALCLFWYLAIVSESRAFILEYIILIPIIFLIDRKNAFKYIKYTLLTLVIGYIIYLISQELLISSINKTLIERELLQDQGRKLHWTLAYNAFKSSPVIGIGPLQYPTYIVNITTKNAHPHNIYLQVLAEYGLVGFSCFMFILTYCAYKFIRFCCRNKSMINLLILASLICGFTHAGLSGVFVMPLSQLTAVIIFALAFSQYQQYASNTISLNKPPKHLTKSHKVLFYILTVIMGITLILTAGLQAITYPEYSRNCQKNCYLTPNFWSNGWYGIDENIELIKRQP
ncbi:O-antigen ligase family protein [Francisellaceae bacterium]|nr:O-antigen ligase family protein [Francisellaceae bacterium]